MINMMKKKCVRVAAFMTALCVAIFGTMSPVVAYAAGDPAVAYTGLVGLFIQANGKLIDYTEYSVPLNTFSVVPSADQYDKLLFGFPVDTFVSNLGAEYSYRFHVRFLFPIEDVNYTATYYDFMVEEINYLVSSGCCYFLEFNTQDKISLNTEFDYSLSVDLLSLEDEGETFDVPVVVADFFAEMRIPDDVSVEGYLLYVELPTFLFMFDELEFEAVKVTPTQSFLKSFGAGIKGIFSGVSAVANTVVSNPYLMLVVGFFFLGGCIGVLGRLFSRN